MIAISRTNSATAQTPINLCRANSARVVQTSAPRSAGAAPSVEALTPGSLPGGRTRSLWRGRSLQLDVLCELPPLALLAEEDALDRGDVVSHVRRLRVVLRWLVDSDDGSHDVAVELGQALERDQPVIREQGG